MEAVTPPVPPVQPVPRVPRVQPLQPVPQAQHTRPRRVHAALAYLPDGWARDVTMTIDSRGMFTDVRAGDGSRNGAETVGSQSPGGTPAEVAGGIVLPGMVNAHSHAFQRAMLGLTHIAESSTDNFWSWRALMYQLALRLTPEQVEAIAAWVYTEMLRGGYTHVCEFHYLHNDVDGRPYAEAAEMSRAVLRAAERVGIGITLLPVLYMTGGFGDQPPRAEQRRFVSSPDRMLDLVRTLTAENSGHALRVFGLAPHSLRAVPPAALRDAVLGMQQIAPAAPLHIHIAEQTGEVDACLEWSGLRPVEWLLGHEKVDARWNLVHATHMTADESARVADARATVVVCPTTEADLGDGTFGFREFATRSGRFSIGTDSQVSRDWQSELRTLEYSQRFALRERNVCALGGRSTGESLFSAALEGGRVSSGMRLGRIEAGSRADWLVARADKLAFAARGPEHYLDSLIFDHHAPDFSDVVIAGNSAREALEGNRYTATRGAFVRTLEELQQPV